MLALLLCLSGTTVLGQDFAGSYRVLSLDRSNACGVFLFGDRRFSLCQGEETQT